MVASGLLHELHKVGVIVAVVPTRPDRLKLIGSRNKLTPALVERVKAHKLALLAILRAGNAEAEETSAGNGTTATAIYTAEERQLMADAGISPGDLPLVDSVKAMFPSAVVVDVRGEATRCRIEMARLIRQRRQVGDVVGTVALRDAWQERLAICTVDGGLSIEDAEPIALEELNLILVR